ncbi:MAG: HD domain-containing phosphohydrolase [Candidatus Dactylopiibacterium sp.]|nr:HD domain-containing phosphohydrolase [Candidatus Dactylopiibacterium sp.]
MADGPLQHEAAGAARHHLRLPLHVIAAAGSTALLLLIALTLAWNAYRNTQSVISTAVDESLHHVSRLLESRIEGILRPAGNQLTLLALGELPRARTLAARLEALPVAAAMLASNPLMDACYVGYPDGDFVLFRALRDDLARRAREAPPGATLMVQTLTRDKTGARAGAYRFYDADGRELAALDQPGYVYDPRTRPWYHEALARPASVLTEPYAFFTTQAVGVTLARRTAVEGVVVGLDTTLADIAAEMTGLKLTPGTRVVLTDAAGRVIARGDVAVAAGERLARLAELGDPVLDAAWRLPREGMQRASARVDGAGWELIALPLDMLAGGETYRVLLAVPGEELFAQARTLLLRQWLLVLLLLALTVPAGFWLTQRVVKPLRQLAEENHRVARFDFSTRELRRSRIAEVDMLSVATTQMRGTISRFLDVSSALNSQLHLEPLLAVVLKDLVATTAARTGAIYLLDDGATVLRRSRLEGPQAARADTAEWPETLAPAGDAAHPVAQAAQARHSVLGPARARGEPLFAVPLRTQGDELVGVLLLDLGDALAPEGLSQHAPVVAFIEALSSTAAVAIETRQLLEAQRALLEAVIQLLAGAIDAKSPYTGGHCQRVPVLTDMLIEAAHAASEGPLRDFRLTPELREAVHIGAWLHDCGKVTTPEYVVDKATKLETLYNRIHEIRTRFEVLKRDAEIEFWKARATPPDAAARAGLEAAWRVLDEEFAFVAACNPGSESLDAASRERLARIAGRRWTRTLDDRLGLSRDELLRLGALPARALPASERLLADKPEHSEPRAPEDMLAADNPWGFNMAVPPLRMNRGELYNLSVERGTLTPEERYLINAHIVQTIIMLERLPFPRHLRNVPEIAGGHHERMDGTGYPRRLRGEQMSVPARTMAIADVFEALTAADRPYKQAKTLSESLGIMARMVREGHLDGDLFALFVRAGVYREYAMRHLRPEQIDAVDEAALLA